MVEQDNLKNELDNNLKEGSSPHETTKSESVEKVSTDNSSTSPTSPVDPPPTTTPQGAGEIIKPIERRERNPKKG